MNDSLRTYAMMLKPVGSACNLRCEYCYYRDKGKLLESRLPRMSREVLENATRQIFDIHGREATVEFAWHGGEPLLAGLSFFRDALSMQRKYGKGRRILNTLQTNATLLNEEWCAFFLEHGFLIGVSVDGPGALHDAYRRTDSGEGSFERVIRGIALLKETGVPFNTLTAVNARNMMAPLFVYRFLREQVDYIQFLPVVEASPAQFEEESGQRFAMPPGINSLKIRHPVTDFSVTPEGYGAFLCAVFDEWHAFDRGKKHVQFFDVAVNNLRGIPSSLCVHNPLCGHSGCIETSGDVYSCDRYAFPAYKLGNLMNTPLKELMEQNRDFGMYKTYGLPEACFSCPYVKLCFGGCPKDRLSHQQNYLCGGYRRILAKITAAYENDG